MNMTCTSTRRDARIDCHAVEYDTGGRGARAGERLALHTFVKRRGGGDDQEIHFVVPLIDCRNHVVNVRKFGHLCGRLCLCVSVIDLSTSCIKHQGRYDVQPTRAF